MNALVYDLEIVKAVPDARKPLVAGIEYCQGWHDHAGMGVSVIGCYDYGSDRYRVFCKDNFQDFAALAAQRCPLVGFNNTRFDNAVLIANGIQIAPAPPNHASSGGFYDVQRELFIADGLSPEFDFRTHGGYSLSATAAANFGTCKGNGALAPVLWQRGQVGAVIDYCLEDVRLTKRCFDRIRAGGGLRSPKDPGRFLEMRKP